MLNYLFNKEIVMHTYMSDAPREGIFFDTLCEYKLVVYPAPEIATQLADEKEHLLRFYDGKASCNTTASITLASFAAREAMEETLLRYMYRIVAAHKKFDLTFNNFSGIPACRSLHVRVQDAAPLRQLVASLKVLEDYIKSNGCPLPRYAANPHCKLAISIREQYYRQALMDYSHKLFHASFSVGELVLLKRNASTSRCTRVNVFRLAEA